MHITEIFYFMKKMCFWLLDSLELYISINSNALYYIKKNPPGISLCFCYPFFYSPFVFIAVCVYSTEIHICSSVFLSKAVLFDILNSFFILISRYSVCMSSYTSFNERDYQQFYFISNKYLWYVCPYVRTYVYV